MVFSRRQWLAANAALMLGGCAQVPALRREPSIIVDARCKREGSCDAPGVTIVTSIAAALQAAPADARVPWRIAIRPGSYREKLIITRPNVQLIGAGRSLTLLTFSAYAGQKRPDTGNWGTAGSGTLIIRAPDVTLQDLTIGNDYDYPANDALAADDPAKTSQPQAVALMLDQGSDRTLCQRVGLTGFQDTLFANAGRALFEDCVISGNVDFIFGAAQAWFDRCDIVSRKRADPALRPQGYVTAASTSIHHPHGFVFRGCKLLRESVAVPDDSVPLGRPWRPTVQRPDGRYGDPDAVGSAIFVDCFMDSHIQSDGWASMGTTERGTGQRVMLPPEAARFFEFRSSGPGGKKHPARRQLSAETAATLTRPAVLQDWLPG